MGVREWYQVIDVQGARLYDGRPCERSKPLARCDSALPDSLVGHRNQTLGDQDLLARVLAIAVSIAPASPLVAIVGR